MTLRESAIARFESLALAAVEPVKNATVAPAAPAPGELLADGIECADDSRTSSHQREDDPDSTEPPENIDTGAPVLAPQPGEAEHDDERGYCPGHVLQPRHERTFDFVLQ